MMEWIVRLFTVVLLVAPFSGQAEPEQELKLRLDQLEKEIIDIKQQHNAYKKEISKNLDAGVLAQDIALDLENQQRSSMKISGYADVEYKDSNKPDTEPGYRLHHFSLFFTKNIVDKWHIFTEIEYEDGPNFEGENTSREVPDPTSSDPNNTATVPQLDSFTGKIFLEAMNIDFRWQPQASFRVGRFFTPAGIWSVDHYPPFVATQERPMHIRNIFPQLIDGALVFGRVKMASTFFKYDLFTGNGEGNASAGKDNNSNKSVGLTLAIELPVLNHTELGFTSYQDTFEDGMDKIAAGYHVKFQWRGVEFQGEKATVDFTPISGTAYFKEGYYLQLGYRIGSVLVGVRNDVYDDYTSDGQSLTERNSVYVNYRVAKDVVLKLEHHDVMPEFGDDYNLSIASVAVNLGN